MPTAVVRNWYRPHSNILHEGNCVACYVIGFNLSIGMICVANTYQRAILNKARSGVYMRKPHHGICLRQRLQYNTGIKLIYSTSLLEIYLIIIEKLHGQIFKNNFYAVNWGPFCCGYLQQRCRKFFFKFISHIISLIIFNFLGF